MDEKRFEQAFKELIPLSEKYPELLFFAVRKDLTVEEFLRRK